MTAGLTLRDVRIASEGRSLLSLDRTIAPGEVLTVMGPSGSGKSTLLSFLIGAVAPAFSVTGRVLLDGEDITDKPTARRRIGILFQDDVLFPHMSVGENLGFALPPSGHGRRARLARVEEALAEAGLSGFAPRDPATLSGGQRSRVALLRTLLAEPRAILLDEPFARLDTDLRLQMRRYTFDTIRARNLPALLVTHDPGDAEAAGGPVVTL